MQLVGFCRAARTRLFSLINMQKGALRTPCRPSQDKIWWRAPGSNPIAPNDVINRQRIKQWKCIFLASGSRPKAALVIGNNSTPVPSMPCTVCMYNYVSRKCRCRENPSRGNNPVTNKIVQQRMKYRTFTLPESISWVLLQRKYNRRKILL